MSPVVLSLQGPHHNELVLQNSILNSLLHSRHFSLNSRELHFFLFTDPQLLLSQQGGEVSHSCHVSCSGSHNLWDGWMHIALPSPPQPCVSMSSILTALQLSDHGLKGWCCRGSQIIPQPPHLRGLLGATLSHPGSGIQSAVPRQCLP